MGAQVSDLQLLSKDGIAFILAIFHIYEKVRLLVREGRAGSVSQRWTLSFCSQADTILTGRGR